MNNRLLFLLLFLLPCTMRADVFPYLDLDRALCQYGTFQNPALHTGRIDSLIGTAVYGWQSRHTILSDSTAYDPYTYTSNPRKGLRMTLPDGRPCVRLGNLAWSKEFVNQKDYSGAERITYTHRVTDAAPLLILYYAAVLQMPGHKADEQPSFTLQILDEYGRSLSSDCYSFDFVSGYNIDRSQWHTDRYFTGTYPGANSPQDVKEDSICWKDWTAMSIDLSPYRNRTVRIQLTTSDCSFYGHYGYAYFGIDIADRDVQFERCGAVDDSSTLAAPDYFRYLWRSDADPSFVSTERTITVPNDGTLYTCRVMNIENPECYFTISRRADPRVPIASYTADQRRGGCMDTLLLTNTSYVSSSYLGLDRLNEECETALWQIRDPWGNITTSTSYNPDTVFLVPGGEYEISLTAGISGGLCESEETHSFLVVNAGKTIIPFDTAICQGSFLQHGPFIHTEEGPYSDTLTSSYTSCHDTVIYQGFLHINPVTRMPTEEAVICQGGYYLWRGLPYTDPGTYADTLVNQYGCDSILTMHLSVSHAGIARRAPLPPDSWLDPYPLTIDSVFLCNRPDTLWNGKRYDYAGDYRDTLIDRYGCDSVAFLHLEMAGVRDTLYDTVCTQMLPYLWHGYSFYTDTLFRDTTYLEDADKCFDTIYTLYLHVEQTGALDTLRDTVCTQMLPYHWRGQTFLADTIVSDTTYQADSDICFDTIYTLCLHVEHTGVLDTLRDTICTQMLPYRWRGQTFLADTIVSDTTYQADSDICFDTIYTLCLHVEHTGVLDTLRDTICTQMLPYRWRGQTFLADTIVNDTTYQADSDICFDTIYTLCLHTVTCCDTLESSLVAPLSVCADQDSVILFLPDRRGRIYSWSLAFTSLGHSQGLNDCTVSLSDTLPSRLAFPLPPHHTDGTYLRPDNYPFSIVVNGMCGQQLTFADTLHVLYPAGLILQRWNDVLMLQNEHYNGGYTFSRIRWFHDGNEITNNHPDVRIGEAGSYIYVTGDDSRTLAFGTPYWAELTRTDDGRTFCTCPLVPEYTANHFTSYSQHVSIAVRRRSVSVSADMQGTIRLYDILGRSVAKTYSDGKSREHRFSLPAGTYLLLFEGNNTRESHRFVIQ